MKKASLLVIVALTIAVLSCGSGGSKKPTYSTDPNVQIQAPKKFQNDSDFLCETVKYKVLVTSGTVTGISVTLNTIYLKQ